MNDKAQLPEEVEKKALKVLFGSGRYAGLGVGLIFLSFLSSALAKEGMGDVLAGIFVQYAMYLFLCVAVIVAAYIFMRGSIFFINFLIQWVVLASLVILFGMDVYGATIGMPPLEEMEAKAKVVATDVMDESMENAGF